jgi:hypothetical protein
MLIAAPHLRLLVLSPFFFYAFGSRLNSLMCFVLCGAYMCVSSS